jgi:solute carrier family 25 (mitochondrial citrate transporter), member 1
MPFDTVKTRMQSLDARQRYTGTFNCFSKTVKEEGVRALWRGSTTRLARLVLSGGIVFTIYEEMMALMGGATV